MTEVNLFDLMPSDLTAGTSYDYYNKFPNFDEEWYYLLECATLKNADPNVVIQECQKLVDQRNTEILQNFGSRENPHTSYISFDELDFTLNNKDVKLYSDLLELGDSDDEVKLNTQ